VDEAGGGDFFARLLPQTHAWASLEAVREAACRVDARSRRTMGTHDRMRTLFFLGFEIDELVADRLAALRPPAVSHHPRWRGEHRPSPAQATVSCSARIASRVLSVSCVAIRSFKTMLVL